MELLDFAHFKDAALVGLLAAGVYFLRQMKESVEELNIKIAVVIARTDNHEKRLDKLEEKL